MKEDRSVKLLEQDTFDSEDDESEEQALKRMFRERLSSEQSGAYKYQPMLSRGSFRNDPKHNSRSLLGARESG